MTVNYKDREIFVFGSNLAGRHGKGAALHAKKYYGAIDGMGEGLQGHSYGIPTKDLNLKVLNLTLIERNVQTFCNYAKLNPQLRFLLTPIGTGLSGYSTFLIFRMFTKYNLPNNVILTSTWISDS